MSDAPPLTRAMAEFIADADAAAVPPAALDLAERAVVDTVAVTLAGGDDPTVNTLRRALGHRLPAGPSTVLAASTPARTQPRDAALLNGTAAHALDYDDVVDQLIGHPSAVLVPTVLAVAEETGASGRALLDAYCVGYQVSCAVAAGLPIDSHYARGWHSTATVGVLGATAAAGRLLGLTAGQARCALGLAGSLAGGSRRNFGTMTKPLHAGLAASDGVLAALLAAEGFTADPDQLEAALGYLALYGERADVHRSHTLLRGPWLLERHGLNVKRYPCCYYAHRAAGAMLDLVRDGLSARDVAEVTVTVQPDGLGPLIHARPESGLQGKFSLEYVMAACLLDGRLTMESFTDEAVRRVAAQRLVGKVRTAESAVPPMGGQPWRSGYAAVQVRTAGGATLGRRLDVPPGHAGNPLTEDELAAKFRECVAFAGLRPDEAWYGRLRSAREAATVAELLDPAARRSGRAAVGGAAGSAVTGIA